MKLRTHILAFVCVPLLFAACKRDHSLGNDPKGGNSTIDIRDPDKLVVPAGFKFETHKQLAVKVKVANASQGEKFRINIYIDEPSTGKLTAAGITDNNFEYNTIVKVANDLEYIYIEKMDVRGNKVYEKVKANDFATALFSNAQPPAYVFKKSSSGLDCNTGCTQTYNNYTGDVTISGNDVACFTGTYSGKITINANAQIRFCATGTIDTLILNNNSKAKILESAIVTIGKVISNSAGTEFSSWSDSVVIADCFNANNTSENNGKMYIGCHLKILNTGYFGNFGELYITNSLEVNSLFENFHLVTVNSSIIINSGSSIDNFCKMTTKSSMTVNGTFTTHNSSYMKVQDQLNVPSGGKVYMGNSALLTTKDITLGGLFQTTGTNASILRVTNNTNISSGGQIKGKTDICDTNGIETNNGSISTPAQTNCTGFIAAGSCNPEGFGVFFAPDADHDGVADILDDWPNDPLRAFNQYFPCSFTCSNFVFEDLWPTRGDYDFNDLVLAYNIHKTFNGDNKVVDYRVKVKPRAVGAGYQNCFGFSLDDVAPNEVQSVSGQSFVKNIITLNSNGTEAGQSKAVIISFDTPEPFLHRQWGSMFNTIKANPFCESDTSYVQVFFANPIEDSRVDVNKFNPFIIANGVRGKEIHLADKLPTDLANTALFGTADDRSNPTFGRYYKSANGMPWGFEIHEQFDYPEEKASVLNAYNYFDDWAASGGTSFPTWFRNFGGYRNNSLIY